jgi:PleD family two-component response regulator
LETIAEGVETAEQHAQLVMLGCDRAQGYYWSRPVSPEELADWLGHSVETGETRRDAPPEHEDRFRVVIADDELDHRAILARILERSGRFLVVAQADDGHSAIRLAEHNRPDLVILDLSMPNMSGLEALP